VHVQWSVVNEGIGPTNHVSWTDYVTLARNPNGTNAVATYGFNHIGVLAKDGTYTRSAEVLVPNGVTGTLYAVVRTGGPFEFIHTGDNVTSSAAIEVSLAPSPDLVVTDIVAPTEADEG
jgi:hypothetical protein